MTDKDIVEFRAFLPKNVHKLLKIHAAELDESMNDLVILSIIEYLERNDK